jgi:transcriptional regulator with XRE-family HTH domain
MARSVFTTAYSAFVRGLVDARTTAGITQVELARRLSKPQSFVSKVERGERRLDVLEFCAIARAIGTEPDRLLAAILKRLPDKLSI